MSSGNVLGSLCVHGKPVTNSSSPRHVPSPRQTFFAFTYPFNLFQFLLLFLIFFYFLSLYYNDIISSLLFPPSKPFFSYTPCSLLNPWPFFSFLVLFFKVGSLYVTLANLELNTLVLISRLVSNLQMHLSLPSECWHSRCVPPHLGPIGFPTGCSTFNRCTAGVSCVVFMVVCHVVRTVHVMI